jgi:hypothetical protein
MTERDLFILTVYVIVVTYTLYKMIDSLEDQTTIKFDKDDLDRQLEEQGLKGSIDVKFKFEDRYSFDQPKTLSITVDNKFEQSVTYIDWDRSSLSDYTGRSRRVVRLTPDKRIDTLFQPQMSSTIAPGSALSETITAEELLKFVGDSGTLEASAPLVNIDQLQKNAKSPKATDAQKKLNADFMAGKAPLPFTLQLALRISNTLGDTGTHNFHVLACRFNLHKVPWQDALPFNPKK